MEGTTTHMRMIRWQSRSLELLRSLQPPEICLKITPTLPRQTPQRPDALLCWIQRAQRSPATTPDVVDVDNEVIQPNVGPRLRPHPNQDHICLPPHHQQCS